MNVCYATTYPWCLRNNVSVCFVVYPYKNRQEFDSLSDSNRKRSQNDPVKEQSNTPFKIKATALLVLHIAQFKIGHTRRKLPDKPSATFRFIAYHSCENHNIAVTQELLYHIQSHFASVF